jgi:hypothetical protein
VGRAVTLALLSGLAVVWGGYNLGRAALGPKLGEDFRSYYVGSRALLEGRPGIVYGTPEDYRDRAEAYGIPPVGDDGEPIDVIVSPYPPPAALLMVPFALLPYRTSLATFSLLGVACSILVVVILFADRRDPGRRGRAIATGLALSAIFFPTAYSLYMGQINAVLLLLCVLALHEARRGRDTRAGLALAPAIAFKFFPGILLLFFALKRRWSVVFAAVAGVAALVALTLPWFPLSTYADYVTRVLPEGYSGGSWVRNQGLHGVLIRLLADNPYVTPLVRAPALVGPVSALGGLVVLGILVAATRRPTPPASRRFAIEFGLFLVAALLVLSKSWEHYGIFLLPAFFLIGEDRIERFDAASLFPIAASFSVWAFLFTAGAEYRALPRTALAQPLFAAKFLATATLFAVGIATLRGMPGAAEVRAADSTPTLRR